MIATELLHDVADYVNGRIAKVVLNGTFEITDFSVKGVTEDTVTLNYIVPVAEVPLITLVELKDAAGTVLSSNVVNVPITTDHVMLQTITVREAS